MKTFNVGIVGAGHIAEKMAATLSRMEDASCLAIASRTLSKARAFASRFDIPRSYGSYDELIADPDIDLVYVATPHTHHFDVTRRAILAGKPCLVEKSFMADASEAAAIIALAREKGVFVAEAIWPRYMPVREIAREVLASGVIGKPVTAFASLAYNVSSKERVLSPELGGGALLDLGVYLLNFVRMYFDEPIEQISSACILAETGVDASESITLTLSGGILATLQASGWSQGDNQGVIAGTTGYLVFDDLINPTRLKVCRKRHVVEREIELPDQITGFEYQVRACREAIEAGLVEPPKMPHAETLYIMHLMDRLRSEWGVNGFE